MLKKLLAKIKKFVKKNKKLVKMILLGLIVLVVLLALFKIFFYSSAEKAVYGVRLRDIEKHKFTIKEQTKIKEKISKVESVDNEKIIVKGRLIKVFVTFDEGVTADDIKAKFTNILELFDKDTKGYYDITFYSQQEKDGKTVYPVIGYKHKNRDIITWTVL